MKIISLLALISAAALLALPFLGLEVAVAAAAVFGIGLIAVSDYSRTHQPLLVNASRSAIKRRLTSALRLAA